VTIEDPGTLSAAGDALRVLVFYLVANNTFAVYDGTQVSLVDRATLVLLLTQLWKERS
jgi:hypothetical protein